MTIEQKYQRFRVLKKELRGIGIKALEQTREDYINVQRDQMKHGLNSNGEIIGEYKNPIYAEMKLQKNPLADGNVDLELDGDFKRELTIRISKPNKFEIFSQDIKSRMLVSKYGISIFLLNPEYLYKYKEAYFMQPFKNAVAQFTKSL